MKSRILDRRAAKNRRAGKEEDSRRESRIGGSCLTRRTALSSIATSITGDLAIVTTKPAAGRPAGRQPPSFLIRTATGSARCSSAATSNTSPSLADDATRACGSRLAHFATTSRATATSETVPRGKFQVAADSVERLRFERGQCRAALGLSLSLPPGRGDFNDFQSGHGEQGRDVSSADHSFMSVIDARLCRKFRSTRLDIGTTNKRRDRSE